MMIAEERTGGMSAPAAVALEPLRDDHFPLLLHWLNAPHVTAWWRQDIRTAEQVEAKYRPVLEPDSRTRYFVITADGVPVGLIQHYRHADYPDWEQAVGIERAAGTDYLIGESAYQGRGIGATAIALAAARAFAAYPDVDRVVAVPQADNPASRRALEKAGFTLREVRDLESDDPSDSGPGAIYARERDAQ
jgi:aminoglycoside 6'-N-acetyltransferase